MSYIQASLSARDIVITADENVSGVMGDGNCYVSIEFVILALLRDSDRRSFNDAIAEVAENPSVHVEEFPLHINDVRFADACVDAYLQISKELTPR